jgi:hypothetical protein
MTKAQSHTPSMSVSDVPPFDFVPTEEELYAIAKHHATEQLELMWFMYYTGMEEAKAYSYCGYRLNEIAKRIGDDAVSKAIKEAEREFELQFPREWQIMRDTPWGSHELQPLRDAVRGEHRDVKGLKPAKVMDAALNLVLQRINARLDRYDPRRVTTRYGARPGLTDPRQDSQEDSR